MDNAPLVIPGLAPLPAEPRTRHERPQWRTEWTAWYDGAVRFRLAVHERVRDDPDAQAEVVSLVRDDPALFLLLFGWVFEPRRPARRGGGPRPFIPYPMQVRTLRTLTAILDGTVEETDLAISKSRDSGISWALCGFVLWGWLFRHPFDALLVSYKEELVEWKGMKALFSKIDFLLNRLPDWLLPTGFDRRVHRFKRGLLHPTNGNILAGETMTTLAGRGDRVTLAVCDEAAFYKEFREIWGSLRASTDHRVAASTESLDCGEAFVDLRNAGGVPGGPIVLELDWWLHPEHDEAWYAHERARAEAEGDLDGFVREVERNPFAGQGAFVYPDTAHLIVGEYPYRVGDPIVMSIDPGKADETVIHWISFHVETGRYRLVETYYNRGKPAEFYAAVMTGIPVFGREDGFAYDDADLRLMEWVASLPGGLICFGDPAGDNTYAAPRPSSTPFSAPKAGAPVELSFYDRIRYKSAELTRKAWGIERPVVIMKGWSPNQRSYQGRRLALMALLPKLDFHDTPGVRRTLSALKTWRFDPDKPRVAEQQVPLHTIESHFCSALEFWSVNVDAQHTLTTLPAWEPGRRARLGTRKQEETRWKSA